jgi:Transposase, Mutator family
VARLGAQLLMQAALEAEITEFMGRDRYQRAAACDDGRPGSRNGYREVTTTAGPVQLSRPTLRGTTGGLTMTADGLRLLQDLRRSLLDPPRQLRPRTIAATGDGERLENTSAAA